MCVHTCFSPDSRFSAFAVLHAPLSRYRTNGNAHVIEFKNLSVYIAYSAHLFLDKVIGRLPMSWYPDPIHTHKTNPNLEHVGDVSITR